jgi:serine phosphatase RsbU (regulator of sigma subunit)
MLEINLAAAKTNKYAVREGGDSIEAVERPGGGLSVVMVDGQGSGRAAKAIANMVTSKAITFLKEGARDGAVARAANDYLYTFRHGQVSATLSIVSVDMATRTIVISRNSHCPAIVLNNGSISALTDVSAPIGVHAKTRPLINEIEAQPGMTIVVFTDGLMHAGRRKGQQIDLLETLLRLHVEHDGNAEAVANGLLSAAITLDDNRPADDMSVLVLTVGETKEEPAVREMTIRLPIP